MRDGSTPITKYEVEWDSQGIREQQVLEISSATAGMLNGYFSLSFEGHSTGSIEWDTSAEFEINKQRLPTIGVLDVARVNVKNGNGFRNGQLLPVSNVGNVSNEAHTSSLIGADVATGREYLKGTDPIFDEGTVGITNQSIRVPYHRCKNGDSVNNIN